MGIIIGTTSYLLLSLALGLVAGEFLRLYGGARQSKSSGSLGAILSALFGALSVGIGLCAIWKFLPAEYETLARTAALGTFASFFYAAMAGIRLMRYMLPRTTLRVGVLFLPAVLSAFWIAFPDILLPSLPLNRLAVSGAAFILMTSSLFSFLFVFSRFFFLSSSPEIKIRSLKIMEGAVLLLAGTFSGMVALPLLGAPEVFSALPAGFLGVAYIGNVALPAFSTLSRLPENAAADQPSSSLADFLYSL